MDILFVNCQFRLFDGIDCGASNRSTAFIQALSLLGNVDVVSFYKEPIVSNITNCKVIFNKYIEPVENNRKGWDSVIDKIKSHLFVTNPYSYYTKNVEKEVILDRFVTNNHYDIIACRYIEDAITCGLLKYSKKLVVEVDDNPSSAFKRQLAITEYPHFWSKYTTLYRANRVGGMANNILKKVMCSFYSNPNEPPCSKSVFLHNVTSQVTEFSPITKETPMRLLIVGWLDYWPNRLGTLYFVENIFPKIKDSIPNVELHIVGKTKDIEFQKWLNSISGVSALGYVEDLEKEYYESRIVVVPIYHGAGTSVKFVEGISMGKAVVTTPMGIRGFEKFCKQDTDYILVTDDNSFIERIKELLLTVEKTNMLAQNGYNAAKQNLSKKRFNEIVYDTITKSLIND